MNEKATPTASNRARTVGDIYTYQTANAPVGRRKRDEFYGSNRIYHANAARLQRNSTRNLRMEADEVSRRDRGRSVHYRMARRYCNRLELLSGRLFVR